MTFPARCAHMAEKPCPHADPPRSSFGTHTQRDRETLYGGGASLVGHTGIGRHVEFQKTEKHHMGEELGEVRVGQQVLSPKKESVNICQH